MKKFIAIIVLLFFGWLGGITTAVVGEALVSDQLGRLEAAGKAYQR